MVIKPWELLESEEIKVGRRKIEKRLYLLPNGKQSDFYIKKETLACAVLSFTPERQVILAKQFRPGPNKILLEIPGGKIEPGEIPIKTAERELLEETGYKGDLMFVTTAFDCAYSSLIRYCYVAINCKKVAEQKLDDTEFIDVVLLPLGGFKNLLRSGEMTDVEVGYLGLDYIERNLLF